MRFPLLSVINGPEDVKHLSAEQLNALAGELRTYMIETVSKTGGHLASSLGAVEIIIALHRVFSAPEDMLVFDVGHQAYAHKILTGRRDSFPSLRQKDGLSGFPKRSESMHDSFNTGHATTSVSAALGMARAKQILGEPGSCVALIGDGAMTGGMFFEALNDGGQKRLPLIIVLNDNDMSIARNVGMLRTRLSAMRLNKTYIRFKRFVIRELDTSAVGKWLSHHMDVTKTRIKNFLLPDLLFEEFGFIYLGPIDGHNIEQLEKVFARARQAGAPVIVHTVTRKGKGYPFSEKDPEKFHGIAPFDLETGLVEKAVVRSNSDVFGEALTELAKSDGRITAITAAMPSGTGLDRFAEEFPDRFFDVGIAEEHAVTMAAGMAVCGLRPVVAIYSSFLQRSYDQLMEDVCLQNLPVVIAIDRAGLVGEDGETHQGIYDPVFLSSIPNLTVLQPASQEELVVMLGQALRMDKPVCIRYGRGHLPQMLPAPVPTQIPVTDWQIVRPVRKRTIIASGPMLSIAFKATEDLDVGLVNARSLSPVDHSVLSELREKCSLILTVEESISYLPGAIRQYVYPVKIDSISLPTEAIRHASIAEQRRIYGLTDTEIRKRIETEEI